MFEGRFCRDTGSICFAVLILFTNAGKEQATREALFLNTFYQIMVYDSTHELLVLLFQGT